MTVDTANKLSRTTVTLHWIVGIAVIGMLSLGLYMTETETYALYPWHKSFGVIVFFFAFAYAAWRLKNGWPQPVRQYHPSEQMLAKIVHYVLLIGVVLMPISGFLMSAFGGSGVAVFGLELVARNPDPADPSKTLPHNEGIATFTRAVHGWVAYTLVTALVLHIAGALKHHLIDKDGTLRRMLGARV